MRRDRMRTQIVGGVAFVIAVAASGVTAAAWYRLLEPVVTRLLG